MAHSNQTPSTSPSRWPSGGRFLLYCAGISLLLLVVYVMMTNKQFVFGANSDGVHFSSLVNSEGTPSDPKVRAEKSEQVKEKVEETFKETKGDETAESGPFNGKWEDSNGYQYVLKQQGSEIAMLMLLDDEVVAGGMGSSSGNQASLTVENLLGGQFSITLEREGSQLRITTLGQSESLNPV